MSATDKYCRWRFFYAYWLNEPAFLLSTQRFFPVPRWQLSCLSERKWLHQVKPLGAFLLVQRHKDESILG